jgi:hypothetical protein
MRYLLARALYPLLIPVLMRALCHCAGLQEVRVLDVLSDSHTQSCNCCTITNGVCLPSEPLKHQGLSHGVVRKSLRELQTSSPRRNIATPSGFGIGGRDQSPIHLISLILRKVKHHCFDKFFIEFFD